MTTIEFKPIIQERETRSKAAKWLGLSASPKSPKSPPAKPELKKELWWSNWNKSSNKVVKESSESQTSIEDSATF